MTRCSAGNSRRDPACFDETSEKYCCHCCGVIRACGNGWYSCAATSPSRKVKKTRAMARMGLLSRHGSSVQATINDETVADHVRRCRRAQPENRARDLFGPGEPPDRDSPGQPFLIFPALLWRQVCRPAFAARCIRSAGADGVDA